MLNFKKYSPYSKKRFFILFACILVVAFYFWTQSRYPALDKKALMGARTNASGIVFDIVFPIFNTDTIFERVLKSTVNWYYTNWKGMTFGLIFSGLVLSILSMFRYRGFKNHFLNALAGMAFGAPLGVCANCAAPISKSIYDSTNSIEATLASLFSSPTFNFVVLTMSFQLLPFELAVTKVALSLVMILLVAPILGNLFKNSPEHLQNKREDEVVIEALPFGVKRDTSDESWFVAIKSSFSIFFQSFFYIVKVTVPAMLLAGFLGGAVIELMPLDSLINLQLSLAGVFLVAAVGTFLPVPMSFDVVIVAILLRAGLHPIYGMVLLFTLGIFSIYPFFVMWRAINLKLAGALFAIVMFLGMAGGGIVPYLASRHLDELMVAYNSSQSNDPVDETIKFTRKNCLKLSEKNRNDCVFQIAQGTKIKKICSVLQESVDKKECEAKYFLFNSDKVKGENCSSLNDPVSRDYCNKSMGAEIIRNMPFFFKHYCELTSNKENSCKYRQIRFLGQNGGNSIGQCELFNSLQNIRECIDFYFFYNFDAGSIPESSCSVLKTDSASAYCLSKVALRSKVEKISTLENAFCRTRPGLKFKQYCNGFFNEARAINSRRIEFCEKINTEFKDKCKASVFSQQAQGMYYKLLARDLLTKRSFLDKENELINTLDNKNTYSSLKIELKNEFKEDSLKVSSFPLIARKKQVDMFERFEDKDLGINLPDAKAVEETDFGWISRGMAAGDYNRDGRQDLVFATSKGPFLYKNLGNLHFQKMKIELKEEKAGDLNLMSVALVDINNDGYLDLFCNSAINGEMFFLLSANGSFEHENRINIPNDKKRIYSRSNAFADVDKNGWVDLFVGNNPPWGFYVPSANAENELLMNNSMKWNPNSEYTDRVKGLTMTSLFSDLNQDGFIDLWVGTDLFAPDQLLMGTKKGFNEIKKSDKNVNATPNASMSYDSGDINNDLRLDVIGLGVNNNTATFVLRKNYCDDIKNKNEKEKCNKVEKIISEFKDEKPETCNKFNEITDRKSCFDILFIKISMLLGNPDYCKNITPASAISIFCLAHFNLEKAHGYVTLPEDLEQVGNNVLLIQDQNGRFSEESQKWGVANTGWAWNGKFADLNNDGWLDIYISTGFLPFRMLSNNYLFINEKGKKFTNQTKKMKMEEVYASYSNVAVDLVGDGNLSIVANATNGPTRFYINHNQNNSIEFNLIQNPKMGNTSAIGARIIITDNLGKSQLREVKASGGYISFGPYLQHFGLEKATIVKQLKIIWPDGVTNVLRHPFNANYQYQIER